MKKDEAIKYLQQLYPNGGHCWLDEQRIEAIDMAVKALQEEPVSTKDKLLALSDGRLHLGWIDDAKVVEFEECLMQFHEDMNNIPQGTASLTRLKDTDGVLHSYSKKLMSMAKEESVSEDSEEAAFDYAEACKYEGGEKLLCVEHFKAGAKWQKEHLWKHADGDDLPIFDREVIVLCKSGRVAFGHRPSEKFIARPIGYGRTEECEVETYDKSGWNIPNIVYWLDVKLPKEIEL